MGALAESSCSDAFCCIACCPGLPPSICSATPCTPGTLQNSPPHLLSLQGARSQETSAVSQRALESRRATTQAVPVMVHPQSGHNPWDQCEFGTLGLCCEQGIDKKMRGREMAKPCRLPVDVPAFPVHAEPAVRWDGVGC